MAACLHPTVYLGRAAYPSPPQQARSPAWRAACVNVLPPRRHGHTAVMEVLVQHGAKTGPENKQGLTPLACALVGGHVPAAKLLQG